MSDLPDNHPLEDETTQRGFPLWETWNPFNGDRKYEKPEELLEACTKYFLWVKNNYLEGEKLFNGKDGLVKGNEKKMRAMTIGGLTLHIGIAEQTWRAWRNPNSELFRPELKATIARVEQVIREQKLIGAAADLLNPNIIARELGLAEKHEHSGVDGSPIKTITSEMSPAEAAELYKQEREQDGGPQGEAK